MSKQMHWIAAAMAMGLTLPAATHAANTSATTLHFGPSEATSVSNFNNAVGQDLTVNNPFSNWGITFVASGGGNVSLFTEAGLPGDVASTGNASSDGFVGGMDYRIVFDTLHFGFDTVQIRYAKHVTSNTFGTRQITAWDTLGHQLDSTLPITGGGTGASPWLSGQIDALTSGSGSTVASEAISYLKIENGIYIDSITFSCSATGDITNGGGMGQNGDVACNIPNGQAGTTPAAPEPASYGLVALGLLGAGLARRARPAR